MKYLRQLFSTLPEFVKIFSSRKNVGEHRAIQMHMHFIEFIEPISDSVTDFTGKGVNMKLKLAGTCVIIFYSILLPTDFVCTAAVELCTNRTLSLSVYLFSCLIKKKISVSR